MMTNTFKIKYIREFCQVIDCEHKTAPYVEKSDFLVVRTSNVKDGRLIWDDMKFTTQNGYEEWTQRAIPEYGDVLFTREAPAGETCLVPKDIKMCMGQRMVLLRPASEKIDPLFFSLVLASEKIKLDILKLSIGSTVSRINIEDIKQLKVPVPSLDEQRKISKILNAWEQAILTTEKLLANSQQQKKALMQQLITGKKRLLDENGVQFGKEWEQVTVSDICKIGRGRVISKIEIEKNNGIYPVYSSQTMNDGVMGYLNSFDFDGEYVTWTTDGVYAGTIFYRTGRFNCTNICGTLIAKSGNLNLKFLSFSLSIVAYKYVSHTLANPKLMNGVMATVPIMLPEIKEQQKIAAVLSAADAEISTLEKKLACLKDEKKALMQQLLTGKRRIKIDAEEAVSA
ncbi:MULTISPECIES: restriction endonuclease subunit S [Citrobacter]|uniref:restriction endonuclease subunit S n=1 Tax=Citrobacter TaxID=544 RepID=UPI002574E48D|nr:restriction endonuclease subunit S [Citrobacter sp. Cf111]MDM3170199.1 restriction endonuclease subunit S [Citrobacter sp. Cf111]